LIGNGTPTGKSSFCAKFVRFKNETLGQLLVMARRQGSYMKHAIVGLFIVFLLPSNLCAQDAARRRPESASGTIDGATSLDSNDSYAVFHSRLESNLAPAPSAGNSVPVSQLRIPSKAMKEFERARKAFQSGDVGTSAEHLQRAVQIYPDFIEAHNTLGLRFIQIGEYQKALAEHEIALSLDTHNAQTHQDLSFDLLLLNRYQEAEAEARQALDLDPKPAAPRYILARALIGQNRVTPEVIQMLRLSEDAFPDASLVLAQIHFEEGRTDQVIAALRHYLQRPSDPDNKLKAECWVAQLSQQPAPTGCPAELKRPSFR
jgi:tetratricopeptide (TPR) repeat protein